MPDFDSPKLVPIGGIVEWSGTLATIPKKFQLCDGTNGTPDLRATFIRGAGCGVNPGNTGGSDTHTLASGEMAQHNHGTCDPGHTHESKRGGSAGSANMPINFDFPTVGLSFDSATTGLTVDNAGSGTPHENRPAYFECAYIMRLS